MQEDLIFLSHSFPMKGNRHVYIDFLSQFTCLQLNLHKSNLLNIVSVCHLAFTILILLLQRPSSFIDDLICIYSKIVMHLGSILLYVALFSFFSFLIEIGMFDLVDE